jgi:hypothetical protein
MKRKLSSIGYYPYKNEGLVAYSVCGPCLWGLKIRHIFRHNQGGATNNQLSDEILGPCHGAHVLIQEVIDRINYYNRIQWKITRLNLNVLYYRHVYNNYNWPTTFFIQNFVTCFLLKPW